MALSAITASVIAGRCAPSAPLSKALPEPDYASLLIYLEALRTPSGGYSSSPPVPLLDVPSLQETYYGAQILSRTLTPDERTTLGSFVLQHRGDDGCFTSRADAGDPSLFATATLTALGQNDGKTDLAQCLSDVPLGPYPVEAPLRRLQISAAMGLDASSADVAAVAADVTARAYSDEAVVFAGSLARTSAWCPDDGGTLLGRATAEFDQALHVGNPVTSGLWAEAWRPLFICAGRPADAIPPALTANADRLASFPRGLQLVSELWLANIAYPSRLQIEKVARSRMLPSGGFATVWPDQADLSATYHSVLIRSALQDPGLLTDVRLQDYSTRLLVRLLGSLQTSSASEVYMGSVLASISGTTFAISESTLLEAFLPRLSSLSAIDLLMLDHIVRRFFGHSVSSIEAALADSVSGISNDCTETFALIRRVVQELHNEHHEQCRTAWSGDSNYSAEIFYYLSLVDELNYHGGQWAKFAALHSGAFGALTARSGALIPDLVNTCIMLQITQPATQAKPKAPLDAGLCQH